MPYVTHVVSVLRSEVANVLKLSINAVCALQIHCKLLPFPVEKSCRNEQTIKFSFVTKCSICYIKPV